MLLIIGAVVYFVKKGSNGKEVAVSGTASQANPSNISWNVYGDMTNMFVEDKEAESELAIYNKIVNSNVAISSALSKARGKMFPDKYGDFSDGKSLAKALQEASKVAKDRLSAEEYEVLFEVFYISCLQDLQRNQGAITQTTLDQLAYMNTILNSQDATDKIFALDEGAELEIKADDFKLKAKNNGGEIEYKIKCFSFVEGITLNDELRAKGEIFIAIINKCWFKSPKATFFKSEYKKYHLPSSNIMQ